MKDLGKTNFCLGLNIEHFREENFLRKRAYTETILEAFLYEECSSINISDG